MSSNSISNAIVKLRNALAVHKKSVCAPLTNMAVSFIRILKEKGFIETFSIFKHQNNYVINILLKYCGGKPAIQKIVQISRPGRRIYKQFNQIEPCAGGLGIFILSTSKGVMTDKLAHKLRVGGEVLCSAY